jgi:ABC-2 type transport system ATP-binding protein
MLKPTENFPPIELSGVTKRYGKKLACNKVDLTVREGTTFGLLGPNGAGKSSLIRILMGLSSADSGEVRLFGENARVHSPALRQRIGYVPEVHFVYRWMTVGEVLRFVRRLYPLWDRDLVEQMLSAFELPLKKKVGSLSKGMTTKLSLVLALAHNPDLLILDEPTSGLDPLIREEFLESVLQRHLCKGRTVFFSSHHFDDVERVADDVGIFVDGRFIALGRVDDLRSSIKRLQIVLPDGKLPVHIPEQVLFQRLSRRDWTVTVNPFTEELFEELIVRNHATGGNVIDLGLEEIFKDVIRGTKVQKEEVGR